MIVMLYACLNVQAKVEYSSINVNDITLTMEHTFDENFEPQTPYDTSEQSVIIRAYRNNSQIWSFKPEDQIVEFGEMVEGLSQFSDMHVNSNTLYMTIGGTLCAIDVENGQIKWKHYIGSENSFAFDNSGNIYISAFYRPNVVVFNKEGTELYRDESLDYMWVDELSIIDDVLRIHYNSHAETGRDGYTYLDISQFQKKDITVTIDGIDVEFDQLPIIQDGRTLVPLRAIFEALGAAVEWNPDTSTVIATKDGIVISLKIGTNTLYVNGAAKTLDVPARIVGGRTLIPVRAVSESFGCSVDWDSYERRVIISTPLQGTEYQLNETLLSCLGASFSEVVSNLGNVREVAFGECAKLYQHGNLKTEIQYASKYNYDDLWALNDVNSNAECLSMLTKISELLPALNRESITIEQLEIILGECSFNFVPENEVVGPFYQYQFSYNGYEFFAESNLSPIIDLKYIWVSKK